MLKSKKKKKVVDISVDEAVGDAVIQAVDIEPLAVDIEPLEPIAVEPEPLLVVETVIQPVDITPPIKKVPIEKELKNIVKTTDLTECPKCHKMIMNKTLKYSHSKTCGIVKNAKTISTQPDEPVIHEPVIKHVKPVSDIKPPKAVRAQADGNVIKHVKPVSAIKLPNTVFNQPPPPIITLDEVRHQYFNNVKQQRTQLIQKLFSNAIYFFTLLFNNIYIFLII